MKLAPITLVAAAPVLVIFPLKSPVVPLIAPAVSAFEPILIVPKPTPMDPPVRAPVLVMFGCAAVESVIA